MSLHASIRPRVGVSACALGELVRFDGGHKRSHFVDAVLGSMVDFVKVCPEAESGMGIPRPTLRLVRDDEGRRRVRETKSGKDHTAVLEDWSAGKVEELAGEDLDGFILTGKSPSCGMERVRVYRENGMPHDGSGVGVFAEALMARFPHLVVEEANRLNDLPLRDNFCFRLFAARRVKELFAGDWARGEVVDFHTREKMALLARGRVGYQALGRLVARISEIPREDFAREYIELFLEALRPLPSRGRLLDALQHLMGHFKEDLEPQEKSEFLETMQEFHAGRLPLAAVGRLLRVLAARHDRDWVAEQSLLDPAPNPLGLYTSA